MMKKIAIFGIVLIGVYLILWLPDFSSPLQEFGITFSESYAESLGLNPQKLYLDILNELNIKKIRLVAYWNKIQPAENKFNFNNLDFYINEAQKRNKELILAIGFRVPRWPECHIPGWAQNLPEEKFKQSLFSYLETIINRYKDNKTIKAWQVENEVFLNVFGECPKITQSFFNEELKLVKTLNPERPILITDSGELSFWNKTAGRSEIFGTTLYRIVWNKYMGFFKHYLPPIIYTLRARMVEEFTATKKVIIAELQAEPWIPNSSYDLKKQSEIFTLNDLKNNINFAKKTGISEIYLWGVEWWYLQKINNNPFYWQEIIKVLNTAQN